MPIRVTEPDIALEAAFLRMLDDYEANDPENGDFYSLARTDFAAYVQTLSDEERGINLRPGIVPCSHRWLVDDSGEVVGVVRIRHNIDTPFLAREAGHIGYDVPPSHRGRGNGVQCLQAGIERARELEIDRVMVCADTPNRPSWRVIEKCGGVLESEFDSEHYGCLVRRYWIQVT